MSLAFAGQRVVATAAATFFGEDEMDRGDPARAVALLQRAVQLGRSAHAQVDSAMSLHSLGDAEMVRVDTLQAAAYYLEALKSDTALTLEQAVDEGQATYAPGGVTRNPQYSTSLVAASRHQPEPGHVCLRVAR